MTVQQFEEADTRAAALSKQVTSLESQVADIQDSMNEETRQKLGAQSKLRAAEEKLELMQDQLEDEEEQRKAMEQKVNTLTVQVGGPRGGRGGAGRGGAGQQRCCKWAVVVKVLVL